MTQDIRDIKARPWNFITILVVITGGVLTFDTRELTCIVKVLLLVGVGIAAYATFAISRQSVEKMRARREVLKTLYKDHLQLVGGLRADPAVTEPDQGLKLFEAVGRVTPVLSVLLVGSHLLSTEPMWLVAAFV